MEAFLLHNVVLTGFRPCSVASVPKDVLEHLTGRRAVAGALSQPALLCCAHQQCGQGRLSSQLGQLCQGPALFWEGEDNVGVFFCPSGNQTGFSICSRESPPLLPPPLVHFSKELPPLAHSSHSLPCVAQDVTAPTGRKGARVGFLLQNSAWGLNLGTRDSEPPTKAIPSAPLEDTQSHHHSTVQGLHASETEKGRMDWWRVRELVHIEENAGVYWFCWLCTVCFNFHLAYISLLILLLQFVHLAVYKVRSCFKGNTFNSFCVSKQPFLQGKSDAQGPWTY